ncbi:MAG TPA: hypothetical protein VF469_15410 [Kofleriaceae bacterium]
MTTLQAHHSRCLFEIRRIARDRISSEALLAIATVDRAAPLAPSATSIRAAPATSTAADRRGLGPPQGRALHPTSAPAISAPATSAPAVTPNFSRYTLVIEGMPVPRRYASCSPAPARTLGVSGTALSGRPIRHEDTMLRDPVRALDVAQLGSKLPVTAQAAFEVFIARPAR